MPGHEVQGRLEQDFLQIYDKLSPILWRHAYYRVNDKELANDLVSETFTRAWDYVRQNSIVNLRAFLYRVLHNLIVDHYRQKHNLPMSLDEIKTESNFEPIDKNNSMTEVESDLLRQQLDKLAAEYRTVLLWRYVDDLPIKQISKLSGRSIGATYVLIHRALARLKAIANA